MSDPSHSARRAAGLALLVTCGLALAKFVVWAATGSLVVLSQALDSLVDIVALGLLFFGVRLAAKPADDSHHYGHGKAENLVAFTQTLILGLIVIAVGVEAIRRLADDPSELDVPWYALALLALSIVIDVLRVRHLIQVARAADSDALRAGALNLATDIGTAGVALFSLIAVRAGVESADAIGGLIVAAAVAVAAIRLGRRSVDVLMDRAPDVRVEAIAEAAAAAPGVAETRRVRVRSAGSQLFADVTVAAGRTASLERAHDIAEGVEAAISKVAPGSDVVVHVEPVSETGGLVERVQAAASRADGVHEVHNVLVHAFDEAGKRKLHVTLHAKVDSALSVQQAHDVSDRIETIVATELGTAVRVDSHIEPLEPTEFGRNVTDSRPDVVAAVQKAASEETEVLDCHEVLVTAAGTNLAIVAHVRGRRDLPLARLHDASRRIENAIHASFPDVGAVVIHFEPA
jgi:cation diffusion facilitator family transporter